jgi:triacylglycerol lipase
MLCLLTGLLASLTMGCASANEPRPDVRVQHQEVVILVHGLGRTEFSMMSMGRALERQGYHVINWGYSSTCCSLAEIGAELADDVRRLEASGPSRIHFVGHSLGNIIVRWVLTHEPPVHSGRVVMLAPPNQGSKVADRYAEPFGWLVMPLDDLMTERTSTVRTLDDEAVDREIGIIAGAYDGKVTVEETRWKKAKAHVIVPAAHTFIMNRLDVQTMAIAFLRYGRFESP